MHNYTHIWIDINPAHHCPRKDYMAKHPGGQDILLGVLGRDATVEFETMRHSQIALKQLRGFGKTWVQGRKPEEHGDFINKNGGTP